ncbi:MAG: hypothetical protein AABZ80_09330 [Gemmatimonadota bacterium]
MTKPAKPRRIRRRYKNEMYPLVLLRFEDGHEIKLKKGEAKSFDAYAGETVKVVVLWDASANERETVVVQKAEQFEEAK